VQLSQDERADALLSTDPFALLVGMLLDQQFPMERAFFGPRLLLDRLVAAGFGVDDRLDPAVVAAVPEDQFATLMAGPPAVHRYPQSMGQRVQTLARIIVGDYGGDAEQLWQQAGSGADLLARLKALPGFGAQKAKIFVALLAKQRGLQPPGWEQAAGDYALPGYRSVADVVDEASLAKVRETKRSAKAAARA
jgi:uncharacterized HhH-GPD family protein